MSIHAQNLLALARQEFSSFEGAAERALIRAKGRCLREHCAQQRARIDALIRRQPRAVAIALVEVYPPAKLALFPAPKTPAARAQQQQKPPAPKPVQGGMPTLTPAQKKTFKF